MRVAVFVSLVLAACFLWLAIAFGVLAWAHDSDLFNALSVGSTLGTFGFSALFFFAAKNDDFPSGGRVA